MVIPNNLFVIGDMLITCLFQRLMLDSLMRSCLAAALIPSCPVSSTALSLNLLSKLILDALLEAGIVIEFVVQLTIILGIMLWSAQS